MNLAEIEQSLALEADRRQSSEGKPVLPEVPGGRYTSSDFEALEKERLWRRSWLCAGRMSEIPNGGDFRVFKKAGPPILIVRGKDDVIRAFYNMCRHRGAPVVRGEEGKAGLLRCQFHSWAYNLKGELIGVPDEAGFPCLNREERGLIEVRCEIWDGWIFVNLDSEAEPLPDFLGSVANDLKSANMASLRLVERRTYQIRSNWKVTLDAFLESYHLSTIHPKTAAAVNDAQSTSITLLEGGHSWEAVYRRKALSQGVDEGAPKPDIQGLDEKFQELGITYSIFPNIVSPIDPVGFPVLLMWPVDLYTSEVEIYFLGPDWGDGPRPPFYDGYFAFFNQLMQEDIENLAPMQDSLMSGAFSGSLLHYRERRIYWLNQAIDNHIGRANIPLAMQTPDILQPS